MRCGLAVAELTGAYAIAVVDEKDPTALVVARMGAPLLLGLGDGENFAASDASALIQVTPRVVYLEEGDCAEIRRDGVRIVDAQGGSVERPVHVSSLTASEVELGQYRHYMQKEIFEQPMAVANTLELVVNARGVTPAALRRRGRAHPARESTACSSSRAARAITPAWSRATGSKASRAFPATSRSRANTATANRCRIPKTLVVTISQSGETADTLAALHHARSLGQAHTPHDLQRSGIGARAAVEAALSHARRPGDRRRVDQGIHDPARRAGAAHDDARQASRID